MLCATVCPILPVEKFTPAMVLKAHHILLEARVITQVKARENFEQVFILCVSAGGVLPRSFQVYMVCRSCP